ncbi:hypothetical protein DEO72_LG8g1939 [Vigna unguiculata]|uniref:LisH domain-containing protein n=1 Tax=Vigna unguiculata TaxID=3917 RepID=A0A4D6MUW8_VIGUN|nr:hypothetical protein DEO72_LG8g1939 [Vigna unguiculata]
MTCARGNVPETVIAFIVDRYLSRNQFSQTQATFRNEASILLADSPANENLLTLEGIVDQYIFMKKQNNLLDKENVMLMQEKHRIQMLLQDLQNVLDSFNARSSPFSNAAAMIQNSAVLPPMQNSNRYHPGIPMQNSKRNIPVVSTGIVFPMQNTMSVTPTSMDNISLSSPMIRMLDRKRKDTPSLDGCTVAKKPRGRPPGVNTLLPSPSNKVDFGSSSASTQSLVGNSALRGSLISTNPVSRTLPIIHSIQSDTHVSLPVSSDVAQTTEISPTAASCNGEVITPCYNVISANGVMVQPEKQMVYKKDNDISPIEPHSDQTNNGNAYKPSTETLDKPLGIPPSESESDKDRDIWAQLGLDDIDFSCSEEDDSFTKMIRDIEIMNENASDQLA